MIGLWVGWAAAAPPEGPPMWMTCRERRQALALADLGVAGPLPELPRTDAPPDLPQGLGVPKLVVDAAGARALDGAPIDALPAKLGQVLLLVDHRLDANGSARLLDDLAAAGATPLVVRLSGTPAAEDVQDPDVWPEHAGRAMDEATWTKHLARCGPGEALVEVGGPCDALRARWRLASENWRCDLSDAAVAALSGPLAVPVEDPVSILLLRLERDGDAVSWVQGFHTWAQLSAGVHRIAVGELPAPGEELTVSLRDLERLSGEAPRFPRGGDRVPVRCTARVRIGTDGVPVEVSATGCPEVFQEATRKALLTWRWAPPFGGRAAVVGTIAVNFRP